MPFNERKTDLWDYRYGGLQIWPNDESVPYTDAICITTNGDTRRDGAAIMGRGVALQAKRMFQDIEFGLGRRLQARGNRVFVSLQPMIPHLVTFPVKHHFRDKADTELIRRSCRQLVEFVNAINWRHVVLPRPGCGSGQLDWETEVRPILEEELDLRFTVVNNE